MLTRERIRNFWCEFFNSHEWYQQETFTRDGTLWIVMMCNKCGKIRIEPALMQEMPHIEVVAND